jgi:hypothetical protein
VGCALVATTTAIMLARSLSAQVAPNRALTYLPVTDAGDTRALWVNPAGLGMRHGASVLLDLTVRRPGPEGQLGQLSAGFNTRGLSFGYQRDIFPGGVHGHTYRLGLGVAAGRLSAGTAVAFHRGGTTGTTWDLGARYEWGRAVSLGAVLRNLGQPVVRGVRLTQALVSGVTVRPAGELLALSVQGTFGPTGDRGYAGEARAQLPMPLPLGFLARIDTDRHGHRRALVIGVSWGREDQAGLVASAPGDASRVDALSAYGVSTRTH